MTDVKRLTIKNKVRFITAASLFDGHDSAINIMRRILQSLGAEVIHLGHNRSVHEIVNAAIEEDAQGIAISSYQGGHVEYFTYVLDLLKERDASHIKVFGGGGGVIVPEEIALLQSRGVAKIFSPEDGMELGLEGMIQLMLDECDFPIDPIYHEVPNDLSTDTPNALARLISSIELASEKSDLPDSLSLRLAKQSPLAPIVGITGTGGAGKSSLVDEMLLRYLEAFPDKTVAVLSVDPTRRRTGGALLGDRIRMNAASNDRVYMRSMGTRQLHRSTSQAVSDSLKAMRCAGYDLVILETAGIGQSDSEVTELSDISVYVMTPEFGAPTQLEKIDMLDYADLICVNKFDKPGGLDALKDVRKTYQRNHKHFEQPLESMPVFGACAHRFQDPGVNRLFNALIEKVQTFQRKKNNFCDFPEGEPNTHSLIASDRTRYLGDIVETIRQYRSNVDDWANTASRADGLYRTILELGGSVAGPGQPMATDSIQESDNAPTLEVLGSAYNSLVDGLPAEVRAILHDFEGLQNRYSQEEQTYSVRGKAIHVDNYVTSLSDLKIPKVTLPKTGDWGEQVRFTLLENVPGQFPYTSGVFPFKRKGEDPTRMFAGEGPPEQTNRRFHFVSKGQTAVRLSTAFDSVTLYGADPDQRPDIFGKIGNSGVSICTLDDAKRLYSGFDLCAPTTSVSMTINGPAATILAFFLNSAIDAACERKLKTEGQWDSVQAKIEAYFAETGHKPPQYRDEIPEGHDRSGLGFLGLSADKVMPVDEYNEIKSQVLNTVRGTVQADILKEDQAQNTCIFSTEFAIRMMGDLQAYFIEKNVRNFYSVSISGYHIAEAGANPISQLAFTLANGFTLVEYYRSRGMDINRFAPNLSFFFSNGLDPEYSVIGRVARRIWAVAMKNLYGADERSQMLKYHIQTSGRSLHAQETDFNDIRTTLQALYAISDNCNSLHTNAYDEAITTPTEESVRRAIAIQLIINNELGYSKNENPIQGSYFIEQLTDIVEAAVLKEFESLDRRGGVLGAMETMYQRSKIQEESMLYEQKKHSGDLPIIGVTTFINPEAQEAIERELVRSSEKSRHQQIEQVQQIHKQFKSESEAAIQSLKATAKSGDNLFAELMETVKCCTLGQITNALYEVGGAYRRNM